MNSKGPKIKTRKIVLSASRRTDIPAFYMDWFMEQIRAGAFRVENPYNGYVQVISARPDDVHTIVFWSKNFGPFLKGNYAQALQQRGFHLFFNFTINSVDPILEPNVPPLEKRLAQLQALTSLVPPQAVTWRFDPVCFYRLGDGPLQNNLKDFEIIAGAAATCNVTHCTTSFVDLYAKIKKRLKAHPGMELADAGMEKEAEVLLYMEGVLSGKGITLSTCCEKEILAFLPAGANIRQAACISHSRITGVYGGSLSGLPDKGQRTKQGCGCMESRDIGSYKLHPCFHNCLFCYANPSSPRTKEPVHGSARVISH